MIIVPGSREKVIITLYWDIILQSYTHEPHNGVLNCSNFNGQLSTGYCMKKEKKSLLPLEL